MATGDDPLTVVLNGYNQHMQKEEARAGAAIRTGQLLTYDENGDFIPHDEAAGHPGELLVAIDFRGRGMERGDSYAVGNNVQAVVVNGGKLFMPVGADLSGAKTTKLVSAGDGNLRPLDTAGGDTEDAVVFQAAEAFDTAGATGVTDVRVVPSR